MLPHPRKVHFDGLDWDKEENKTICGFASRKEQRQLKTKRKQEKMNEQRKQRIFFGYLHDGSQNDAFLALCRDDRAICTYLHQACIN